MLSLGSAAPHFDCSAAVGGRLVRLTWQQLHDHRTLVLLFESLRGAAHSAQALVAVANAIARLRQPRVRVAIVCHNDLVETLAWANRSCCEGGPGALSCPLIVDPDGRIASLYDLAPDGMLLWGQFLIDPSGIVRQMAVSDFPFRLSAEDLLRSIQASGFPADSGLWN